MAKTSKKTAVAGKGSNGKTPKMTLDITQRGIKTYADLMEFYSAAISDIDGGRSEQKSMNQMLQVTKQITALENLRLKIAAKSNKKNFYPMSGRLLEAR